MKDLLRRFWDRMVNKSYDQAHLARVLDELKVGHGQSYLVTTRGANLRLSDTQVQIPAGSLPYDCAIMLSPLTHGNVIAGIKLESVVDLRVPASWSLPKINMRFSLRYSGDYVVVQDGKSYRLVHLEKHQARTRLSA
ncbi:MAG: hypothetical protein H7338_06890 [Candidatus Sericytochromatia bacterium]|nr:hypothetical protein [Candidatus Sericytochromatia bacterium]